MEVRKHRRDRRFAPALALITVLGCAQGLSAATDPALPGAFTAHAVDVDVSVSGGSVAATLHYPGDGSGVDAGAGICPVVVFGHGFSRDRSRYSDLGAHLGSRGFVTIMPDLVCGPVSGCDHSANGDRLSEVLDWLLALNDDEGSIFHQRLDIAAVAAAGHSAGGLHALVAAARDDRVRVVSGLDPVDADGLGAGLAATLTAALAVTRSEPSSCNDSGNAAAIYAAAGAPKEEVHVVGGTHCDPERDGDFFGCELLCGSWSSSRHSLYLRATTAWLERLLRCDPTYGEWAWGEQVAGSVGAGEIAFAADLTPPVPGGVVAARIENGVRVERPAASPCAVADRWRVLRSATSGGPYSQVAELPITTTVWDDTAVGATEEAYYVVRDLTTSAAGSHEGPDSEEIAVEEMGSGVFADGFESGDLQAWSSSS